MLNPAAATIHLCLDPTDMRKSFDTLAVLVREHLKGDPQSGSWFVFRGKRGDRLKILVWDGDGYALWHRGPTIFATAVFVLSEAIFEGTPPRNANARACPS